MEDCTSALDLDPGRVKAYFRRALAREQLGDNANALRDARRVIEVTAARIEVMPSAAINPFVAWRGATLSNQRKKQGIAFLAYSKEVLPSIHRDLSADRLNQ